MLGGSLQHQLYVERWRPNTKEQVAALYLPQAVPPYTTE